VGFESTIPVFERAKTVHALDRAATGIGNSGTLQNLTSTFDKRKQIASKAENLTAICEPTV
jgi:hypothetical protein